jgi:hypothetical protein
MDKKKWNNANMWGVIGIFFLILAGTRFSQTGNAANPGNTANATNSAGATNATNASSTMSGQNPFGIDPRSATYNIEGMNVTLVNGVSEQPTVPGSASKVITRYFGNGALGDIDGDGTADMAFYLTQETGGSGVFYYMVAALNMNGRGTGGYRITDAVLIGDRIAPQPTEIRDGRIYANFADRNPGEPMTAIPSVGKTRVLDVNEEGLLM